jgi:hypothetical protein
MLACSQVQDLCQVTQQSYTNVRLNQCSISDVRPMSGSSSNHMLMCGLYHDIVDESTDLTLLSPLANPASAILVPQPHYLHGSFPNNCEPQPIPPSLLLRCCKEQAHAGHEILCACVARLVEMDKGDVPIQKEYFQLWYMQGTP